MSELPYIVAQTATVFAQTDADPTTFTLDFSLQTIIHLTAPMTGPGWGGGAFGAVVVLEGGPDDVVNTETGVHVVSPWTSGAQTENGLTIVRLEEGGAVAPPGSAKAAGVQQGTIRGRRGTTGRSGGSARAGGDGQRVDLPPGGGLPPGWGGELG